MTNLLEARLPPSGSTLIPAVPVLAPGTSSLSTREALGFESPSTQRRPRPVLRIALLVFSLGGLAGGPILGVLAERAIHRARGALYGIRPAVLATWATPLVVIDFLVLWATSLSPSFAGVLVQLTVLVLNFVFLANRLSRARAALRRVSSSSESRARGRFPR